MSGQETSMPRLIETIDLHPRRIIIIERPQQQILPPRQRPRRVHGDRQADDEYGVHDEVQGHDQ